MLVGLRPKTATLMRAPPRFVVVLAATAARMSSRSGAAASPARAGGRRRRPRRCPGRLGRAISRSIARSHTRAACRTSSSMATPCPRQMLYERPASPRSASTTRARATSSTSTKSRTDTISRSRTVTGAARAAASACVARLAGHRAGRFAGTEHVERPADDQRQAVVGAKGLGDSFGHQLGGAVVGGRRQGRLFADRRRRSGVVDRRRAEQHDARGKAAAAQRLEQAPDGGHVGLVERLEVGSA